MERRARLQHGGGYAPVPTEREWRDAVVAAATGLQRDGSLVPATRRCEWPMLTVGHPAHFPVLVLQEEGLYLVAYPLLADPSPPAAVEVMPQLELLQEVATIVRNSRGVGREMATIALEVHNYISMVAPFGTAVNVPVGYAAFLLSGRGTAAKPSAEKTPAWKPVAFKGKPAVTFTVAEQTRVAQYDSAATPDVCEYFGTLSCKAELEGPADATVTATVMSARPLRHVTTHPCVQALDPLPSPVGTTAFRVRFAPPLHNAPLLSYQVPVPPAKQIRRKAG